MTASVGPATYLETVRVLPRPTPAQVTNFVDYVAGAHSWHKHLPFFQPGEEFIFFLDPHAGEELVIGPDGVARHQVRSADTPQRQRFHYTWQPTDEYRAEFGHLNYHVDAGTSFQVRRRDGTLLTASVPAVATDDDWVPVSGEVAAAGATRVTSTVHLLGSSAMPLYEYVQTPRRDLYNVLYGLVRIGRGGVDWLRFHLKSLRRHAAHLGREVARFAQSLDPTLGPDAAADLERRVREWFGEVRASGQSWGERPVWLREEWVDRDRERNLANIRSAIERMLAVVYDEERDG